MSDLLAGKRASKPDDGVKDKSQAETAILFTAVSFVLACVMLIGCIGEKVGLWR